ncbi:hypothetical protein [Frateuria soli]|uniref:hypothetical protein n=1 Tax=Frateuria soli TaxID=1542730 RepID=UPI001E3F4936|nr:hypothetical protein [Frateuria soli]UGB38507.1 hypothetical protein LQ771_01200 [Frateuria soli]
MATKTLVRKGLRAMVACPSPDVATPASTFTACAALPDDAGWWNARATPAIHASAVAQAFGNSYRYTHSH